LISKNRSLYPFNNYW